MALTNTGQGPSQLKFARDRVLEDRAAGEAGQPIPESRPPSPADRQVPKGSLGIVVVHGVGAQHRGATLLEWSAPMVRAISRWVDRAEKDGRLHVDPRDPPDQIEQAEVDFSGDSMSFIKISIPKVTGLDGEEYDQQTWVMTEAWWAERVSPPSLSAVIDWCGRQGAVRRIVERTISHLSAGAGNPQQPPWRQALSRFFVALSQIGFGLFISIATSIVLVVYALVGALAAIIPIEAVRQAIARIQLNTFLTTWWGDVYLLLRDPVQAANIRDRLITSIQSLRKFGCDRIAVVAHSGGTIVSYTALRDPAFEERIDTLITHGEVISMGRFMEQQVGSEGSIPSSVRLKRANDLRLGIADHPARWIDFWATHDPAPCGPLLPEMGPRNQTQSVLDQPAWPSMPESGRLQLQGVQVQNRKSVLDDHGGYWENDEEFVYPVLKQLEVAGRDVAASRFDPGTPVERPVGDGSGDPRPLSWVDVRRQRVHALTLWGRLIFVAPFLAMVGDFALPGRGLTDELAGFAITALNLIPGVAAVAALFSGWSLPAPWQQILQVVGLLALGTIVGAALIHATLPIGWARPWPTKSPWYWIFSGVDFLLSLAAFLILVAGIPAFGGWIQGNAGVEPQSAALVIVVLLLGLAAVILMLTNNRILAAVRLILDRYSSWIGFLLFLLSALVIASVVFMLATLPGARTWVLALITALIGFRLIGTIGRWRWRIWDERERETFRIGNPHAAKRTFAWIQMVILLGIVLFAAAIVIGGAADLLPGLIGVIAIAALLFMARDAVIANQPVTAEDRPVKRSSQVAAATRGGAP
jgi:hypothetical protein